MVKCKKKIVVLLTVTAVIGCVLVLHAAQPPATRPGKSVFDNPVCLSAKDSNLPIKPIDNFSSRELFFKMMFSVLLVAVLGITAIYISKNFLPKITNRPGKKIHIIETLSLGPRKTVHLLEIEGRKILIASTNENITKLADITDIPDIL